MKFARSSWTLLGIVGCLFISGACSSISSHSTGSSTQGGPPLPPVCSRLVKAEVVALEQAMVLNRFGAFNPSGMLFALKHDVVLSDGTALDDRNFKNAPGNVRLRDDKRPRPMVLRVNEGECLEVRFHNLLMPGVPEERDRGPEQYDGKVPAHMEDPSGVVYPTENGRTGRELVTASAISNDWPHTRVASFHVNGLAYVPITREECPVTKANSKDGRITVEELWICGTDGDNVGLNKGIVNMNTGNDPKLKSRKEEIENQGTLVKPGEHAIYRYRAFREGTYFAYSTGATVGGEGDGGQLGMGLFGAVNVQPKGSRWYRSQVSHQDLQEVTVSQDSSSGRHPYRVIDYEKRHAGGPHKDRPILAMRDGDEIVHSDLNAVVVLDNHLKSNGSHDDGHDTTSPNKHCKDYMHGNSCGQSYREFTVIMHDEVKAIQAFQELEDPGNPLHYVKDGMGINYGVAGMGAMVMGRQRRVAPLRDCKECRAEEFFLSSWANGDPALLLKWDKVNPAKPVGALYPDDPSNVHHSYLGDPVRFRNIHAGPKETHVFHLHAHQWVMDPSDPGSTYLDSQTISPGATFSYEVEFGGSGNRNRSAGDSIFHCHLYPHFAQGMWELWRVHDVFEDGTPGLNMPAGATQGRNYPDAEVSGGTENPAVVPLPGTALPPMPTADFRGYPFYVAGQAGHRPPQPPLDMDCERDEWMECKKERVFDGGLPRHVLTGGFNSTRPAADSGQVLNQDVVDEALAKGGLVAKLNAAKVYKLNPNSLLALAEQWEGIGALRQLDLKGTPEEQTAMKFHEGELVAPGFQKTTTAQSPHSDPPGWGQEPKGYITDWATEKNGGVKRAGDAVFYVNGRLPKPGAPFADPCPKKAPPRQYKAGVIQTELTVNRHGWFDPQARILALEQDIQDIIDPDTRTHLPDPLFFRANSGDCITFMHSNFLPNAMGLDDFQIYTPTDTVGQHIHLVKFDVMASDGSGNGWNYEDGTFSPEEVRERIIAYNRSQKQAGKPADQFLTFKTHPLFEANCPDGDGKVNCEALREKGQCPAWTMSQLDMENRIPMLTASTDEEKEKLEALKRDLKEINEKHPYCAAQRTIQRWYADPILDPKTQRDYTLRTVFTHDHFGPSTHQQHGLYAALVIEPANSVWLPIDRNELATGDVSDPQRVIGGADFFSSPGTGDPSTELRQPLKVGGREDGGPTSTRANIIAPKCIGKKHSNPMNPGWNPGQAGEDCPDQSRQTHDTRREFAMAFADFSILYNAALEPINPEERDLSALRFGRRQVPINLPKPLGISSEDPGTQLINYRNEPLPLRITDRSPTPELGAFDYRQTPCAIGDLRCTGDMANVFSTKAHKNRDRDLASTAYGATVSPSTRALLKNMGLENKLNDALEKIERWRVDFTCALYPDNQQPQNTCKQSHMMNHEPWREMGDPATPILPAYEGDRVQIRLIQGAQEAQHVFTMNGVKWLREPGVTTSGYVNTQPLGISEHFEFDIKTMAADASQTDYLYFGSSVDQLWDGMWGLMRAYGTPRYDEGEKDREDVARLPGLALPLEIGSGDKPAQVCQVVGSENRLKIGISAVRICQLTGECGKADGLTHGGIPYNRRLGIADPNGIIFVRNNRLPGAVEEPNDFLNKTNEQILERLKDEFVSGQRRIEPLVLRAPAGSCLEVELTNHLPEVLPDGPSMNASHASDNFMSMTLDGFNYNQFRMSSTIGLSAPLVAQYARTSDGSNVGLNDDPGSDVGGLVPACPKSDPNGDSCQLSKVFWYAGDFRLEQDPGRTKEIGRQVAVPIEFGAIPLRSFGDAIKHPAHGAIGALVIGPKGSKVCRSNDPREQRADERTDLSATICDPDGNRLYRDFVMVLQDAVDAKQAGWPIPNLKGAEEPDDYGIKAVNYRMEPLWGRRGGDPSIEFEERNEFDYSHVLSSKHSASHCQAGITPLSDLTARGLDPCDPETPIYVARTGSEIRLRIVHPGGHTRQQAITLHGHHWNPFPWKAGSTEMYADSEAALKDSWIVQGSYNAVGPMMAANLLTKAGGDHSIPGDYLFRSQANFVFDGGIWGLLRVVDSEPSGMHEAASHESNKNK